MLSDSMGVYSEKMGQVKARIEICMYNLHCTYLHSDISRQQLYDIKLTVSSQGLSISNVCTMYIHERNRVVERIRHVLNMFTWPGRFLHCPSV